MENSDVSESTAHTVLNYAIIEAIRQQKSVKFKLQIPYSNLAKSNGKDDGDQFPGVGLIIEASLKWGELQLDEDVRIEEV